MMIKALMMMKKNLPANIGISQRDGVFQAEHGNYRLRSAFQPIYIATLNDLQLFAYEGLIRPEIDGVQIVPTELFKRNSGSDLSTIDRLCRSIHIRNFAQLGSSNTVLFLNINPALYHNNSEVECELEHLIADLKSHGIDPSRIVCEIIETKAINNKVVDHLCSQLRGFGFTVAVDDYGSDHSDWARFDLVAPEILKLDGPVFRNLCKTPGAIPALKNLTQNLKETGCILLVEGIESRNQLDIAIEAGAPLLQGYFLAQPETASRQFPQIPSAAFLPRQQELHYTQIFQPSIPIQPL